MHSNLVPVVVLVIVVILAGAAYYYWHGGGSSGRAIEGVVIDKFEREAGTEAGDKPLEQGLNLLTGRSLQKDVFYFVRVRTEEGEEIDMEVPRDIFLIADPGDSIYRSSPDVAPTLTDRSPQS